jgi:hypothetical protein
MAKILILWEMDPAMMPKDPAERMALIGKLGEITKKALDSGKVKDWGIFAGGWSGYSVADESGIETFTRAMMFTPYVKLQVNPVLSLAEAMKVMQSMPK